MVQDFRWRTGKGFIEATTLWRTRRKLLEICLFRAMLGLCTRIDLQHHAKSTWPAGGTRIKVFCPRVITPIDPGIRPPTTSIVDPSFAFRPRGRKNNAPKNIGTLIALLSDLWTMLCWALLQKLPNMPYKTCTRSPKICDSLKTKLFVKTFFVNYGTITDQKTY